MKYSDARIRLFGSKAAGGFTLIELIISIMVTSILGIAVVANYITQQQASTTVRQVAQMQQQLRGAIYIMEQDLRITGYDPEGSGFFGVRDVRRWSITNENTAPVPAAGGSPSLTLAYDWSPTNLPANNANGILDEPTPAYRLFDFGTDGTLDLVRDVGPNRDLVAEGIEAIGFAYAFDADGDGELDRTAAGNIIWAVDSDNDNRLDTNLDANDDGVIDLNDDTNGDRRITAADSAPLPTPITWDRIRMVQIWILARAANPSRDFRSQGQFILVGDQVVPNQAGGFNDNIRRRLLVRTVECRNTGI
jgi:type IV pilus assembly protein PilW